MQIVIFVFIKKYNMSEELKQHIFKNGLNMGLLLIGITLFSYLGGAEMQTNYIVSFGTLILMIVFPIYHTRVFRTSNEGYISFREAFTSCTGILVAAGFLNVFCNILIYNFIDPQYAIEVVDAIIEKTATQLQSSGVDEATIEKMIVDIEQNSDFSPMTLFKGYIFSIIFYTVFGLIVAASTKKEKPDFTEE